MMLKCFKKCIGKKRTSKKSTFNPFTLNARQCPPVFHDFVILRLYNNTFLNVWSRKEF